MVRRFALAAALVGTLGAPIAASAVTREAAPIAGENGLAGQGTRFFLAGIAFVALAVVLLPEDQPASP